MFSQNELNLPKKILRTSKHFHLQIFLYQTFLYAVFQISIRGAFQECQKKTFEIKLLHKKTTDDACFHHKCLDSVLNPPLSFSRY